MKGAPIEVFIDNFNCWTIEIALVSSLMVRATFAKQVMHSSHRYDA